MHESLEELQRLQNGPQALSGNQPLGSHLGTLPPTENLSASNNWSSANEFEMPWNYLDEAPYDTSYMSLDLHRPALSYPYPASFETFGLNCMVGQESNVAPQYTLSTSPHWGDFEAPYQEQNAATFDPSQAFYVQPHSEDSTQLWWRAFLQLYDEDIEKWGFLQKIYTSYREDKALTQPPSSEDVAKAEAASLQATLEDIISRFQSSKTSSSSSIMSSMGKILEILNVVRTTVGFQIGALAWICICAAIKVRPLPISSHATNH